MDDTDDTFHFSGDPTHDWPRLCKIWRQSDHVLSGEVGPTWRTPIQHQLCLDFAERYPDTKPFLIDHLADSDPKIAAYAFKTLIRLDVDPAEIPLQVVKRTDQIGVHIHSRIRHTSVGRFIRDFFDGYDFKSLREEDSRTKNWQEGPLAEYDRSKENRGEQSEDTKPDNVSS